MQISISDREDLPMARLPERPLFAIGDLHGYSDALDALHGQIRNTVLHEHEGPVDLVYLGDYVDRGPDPLGVLDRVATGLELPNVTERRLIGNHDQFLMMAAAIGGYLYDPGAYDAWVRFGGMETLQAMALEVDCPAGEVREALGQDRVAMLEALSVGFRSGDIFCAHAGVNPDRPLSQQRPDDLLWIREPFLSCKQWPHEVTVVHGHTPGSEGVFSHRIGVDTGGCFGGPFTAAEISPQGWVRFHQVRKVS
ncbi:MAG: metallophosphoesterase [Neomegalonema sp.]|nr:metallophosphoesterase [Neomegalonema sp.]